ncbi:LZTR1, partial [Symbiodinium sp. CCMP2456]
MPPRRLWARRQAAEWSPNALVTVGELEVQRRLSKIQRVSKAEGFKRAMEQLLMLKSGCDQEELKEWMQFAELAHGASAYSRDPNRFRALSDNWKKSVLGISGEFNRISAPFRELRQGAHLLTVSHCWESKQHPDPWGSQLHRLVNIISEYQESVFKETGEDAECWIFIDFISLPQYPRTPQQQQFFQRAMRSMHMLYAHQAVDRVIRLEELTSDFEKLFAPNFIDIYHEEVQPQHHYIPTEQTHGVPDKAGQFGPQAFSKLELNSTPYNARGWFIAETQWMSASSCIHGYAPMLPATFQKRVQEIALRFTHRSDAKAVMELQEMVFWKKATACRQLDVAWLPRDEFLLLTEALLHYVNLIFHCDIGSELAAALVNTLRSLGELRLVWIIQCSIRFR